MTRTKRASEWLKRPRLGAPGRDRGAARARAAPPPRASTAQGGRGGGRFWPARALRAHTNVPHKPRFAAENAEERRVLARPASGRGPCCSARRTGSRGRPPARPGHGSAREGERREARQPRVRSHCRFRHGCTEYVSESGVKWMGGGTKRQCDRALCWIQQHADSPIYSN
jgi:hypothetical protein